jgi:hypothetical protein
MANPIRTIMNRHSSSGTAVIACTSNVEAPPPPEPGRNYFDYYLRTNMAHTPANIRMRACRRLSNVGSGSISPLSRSGSRDKLQVRPEYALAFFLLRTKFAPLCPSRSFVILRGLTLFLPDHSGSMGFDSGPSQAQRCRHAFFLPFTRPRAA